MEITLFTYNQIFIIDLIIKLPEIIDYLFQSRHNKNKRVNIIDYRNIKW